MSSYPAPTQNIDFFNPAFFTQDETPLTVADANKLYFKKSGGIITGAVSAPSLTLNGTNVENKLTEIETEIDVNSTKLTDIIYNNNTTSILNNLSVNGILTLPNLPNAGTEILSNKQKTTKISYDAGTSVTTIADTLKSSGTLIVGSQNYNASDEFFKLTDVAKNGNNLTINDNLFISTGYRFELGTITNVEQKIIDVSNAITPFISYNTTSGNIEVEKNMDLGLNDLSCNFMRPLPSGSYGLSQNWDDSYLSFQNGGHHIDAMNSANGLGRVLYLNFYAQRNIILGSHVNNSTTTVNGNLNIIETTGTVPTAFGGSLTLAHNNAGGTSSIVFKSNTDVNSDFGYISYQDNYGGSTQNSLLEIGVQNEGVGDDIDNIALMPSGYVGINTRTPQTMLDVNGDTNITGNLQLGSITDVEDAINNAGNPYITYDTTNQKLDVTKDMDLGINDLTCNFMRPVGSGYGLSQNWTESYLSFENGGHHIDAINTANGLGRDLFLNFYAQKNIYLGSWINNSTTFVNGNLNITENTGTAPTPAGGSLTLTHNDAGGTSSIVFKSNTDNTSDYGYISYRDNDGVLTQNSLLEIGVQNEGVGDDIDNIALMPSGYVGINTRTPQTMLDVNGDTNITGNLKLGSILDVEDAINNAGGVPSITYDEVTQTTTFDGNFVTVPQLTITPEVAFNNATQEIYSKHSELNGVAELKLGNDIGGTIKFNNILKSENGKATFYGNNAGSETKFMEYDPIYDKVNITKDMDLGGNVLYIDNLYIQEATGTAPIGQKGSITLIHDDPGGTSSIVFRSSRDGGVDHGYISYTDDYDGSTTFDRSLLEIGCKNDTGLTTIDNIALMPSGNVGINTRTPQATLDVNGDISCNQMTMNNVLISERYFHPTDGNGISIRTLNNPNLLGSIFDVRATGRKASLYCGINITSSGANPFYFGFINADANKGDEGNTEYYRGKLDTDGSVDCTEIKVNSIPINSFTNFKFGTNFTISGNWGRGNRIRQPNPTLPSISHGLQFVLNSAQGTMTCEQLGTYEITSTVIYRNTNTSSSTGRRNPCIGIAINNDTNDDSGTNIAPKWDLIPHFTTPFACNYARFDQGKVCTLTAKRIHHFTNDTDIVSVNTYDQANQGDLFQDVTTTYLLLSASIQFKYIGNFDNIRGG